MSFKCLFGHKYISVRDVNHDLCKGCYTELDKIYNPELKPKYPKGYCVHGFKVCRRCGKEKGYGSHGELSLMPDGCKRQINKMKEDFMKEGVKFSMLLMVLVFFFTVSMSMVQPIVLSDVVLAQSQPPAQGIIFGLSASQDNAWLFSPGDKKGFFAVGAGFDVASYSKKLSPKGSTLALYLHGTVLTPVTAYKNPIFGGAINLDVLQLLTGTNVKILIPQLSLLVGPVVAYDVILGKIAYGGLVNFNYKF